MKQKMYVIRARCRGGSTRIKHAFGIAEAVRWVNHFQDVGCQVVSAGSISRGFNGAQAGASCSDMNRWLRGGIGFVVGSVIGSVVGGVVAKMMIVSNPLSPGGWLSSFYLPSACGTLGAGVGTYIGARKPDC